MSPFKTTPRLVSCFRIKLIYTNYSLCIVLLGEDIAFGGVFRCTEGLQEKYGLSTDYINHTRISNYVAS